MRWQKLNSEKAKHACAGASRNNENLSCTFATRKENNFASTPKKERRIIIFTGKSYLLMHLEGLGVTCLTPNCSMFCYEANPPTLSLGQALSKHLFRRRDGICDMHYLSEEIYLGLRYYQIFDMAT